MLACYAGLYWSPLQAGASDPDRYYHLALGRMAAENGLLRVLPQVEDLGWGQYFPDKEFLFHVLTELGYRGGRDAGVLAIIPLLGSAIALVLYATLARVLPPWKAALFTLLPIVFSARFLFRLMLLRPHVLAILFFCLLLWAVLGRRRLISCAAVFGFVLAYHAFYVPLIAIVCSWPLRRTATHPAGLRLEWMVLALVAGLLLNPYFPSNLIMALTHIWVAIGTGMPADMRSGIEVMPLTVAQNVAVNGVVRVAPLTLACLLPCYALGIYRGGTDRANYRYLLIVTLVFAALGLKSARAIEYSIPCAILLGGYALRHFSSARARGGLCHRPCRAVVKYEFRVSVPRRSPDPADLRGLSQRDDHTAGRRRWKKTIQLRMGSGALRPLRPTGNTLCRYPRSGLAMGPRPGEIRPAPTIDCRAIAIAGHRFASAL